MKSIYDVPKANGMPLERWTAYMYAHATSLGLKAKWFYICTRKGMSSIVIKAKYHEELNV